MVMFYNLHSFTLNAISLACGFLFPTKDMYNLTQPWKLTDIFMCWEASVRDWKGQIWLWLHLDPAGSSDTGHRTAAQRFPSWVASSVQCIGAPAAGEKAQMNECLCNAAVVTDLEDRNTRVCTWPTVSVPENHVSRRQWYEAGQAAKEAHCAASGTCAVFVGIPHPFILT